MGALDAVSRPVEGSFRNPHTEEELGGMGALSLATDGPSFTNQGIEHKHDAIVKYLRKNCSEFLELDNLRRKGWSNPDGDKYFDNKRKRADNANDKTARGFFNLMKKIGFEMQNQTAAFKIETPSTGRPHILDMCMAPGGYLEVALAINPGIGARGFCLPESDGGHKVFLSQASRSRAELRYMDITMLAADMGVENIPEHHPDAGRFLSRQFQPGEEFGFALCDGHVLRTHDRADYRKDCEAQRLITTQLALSLEHLAPGGTMIVLLHKVDAWDSVLVLKTFSGFSRIRLHKPMAGHRVRSSFYMIATHIQSKHPLAIKAVARWKQVWKAATFGQDNGSMLALHEEEPSAEEVIRDFGDELVRMGRNVWKNQAEALASAPFITG